MKRRAFFGALIALPAGITAAAKAGPMAAKPVGPVVDPFQAVLGIPGKEISAWTISVPVKIGDVVERECEEWICIESTAAREEDDE